MLKPLIRRRGNDRKDRSSESGFTMALVTVALFAIIGMAALSIDIGTLYQAKAEAQRSADAAALSGARVISLSGITGDPSTGNSDGSWHAICGGATSQATLTAQAVAEQNTIAGVAPSPINVTYSEGSATTPNTDCDNVSNFALNPIVNVTVQRSALPIFFGRVFSLIPGVNYSGSGVSATASAEAYNPANSQTGGGGPTPIPVQPRCVKPWIIPNADPLTGGGSIVDPGTGAISNPGIKELGAPATVGESFALSADCILGRSGCSPLPGQNPPQWNGSTLEYIPAQLSGTPGAVPSCANSDPYQEAIGGCDQSTVYACGINGGTSIDLIDYNPGGGTGDTSTAVQCLIHQTTGSSPLTQDWLAPGTNPPNFPFQIQAGAGSPLVTASLVSTGNIITSSNSIATIPIANFVGQVNAGSSVTVVGFLQVFINSVDTTVSPTGGNVSVTVLNVTGCGSPNGANPINGTSPVPVRLITPP